MTVSYLNLEIFWKIFLNFSNFVSRPSVDKFL